MEQLATFDFYQNTYKGSLIPDEATFDTNCMKAGRYLGSYTTNKAFQESVKSLDEVKLCVCELAESFFVEAKRISTIASNDGKEVSSERVGDYSVSYATGSNSSTSEKSLKVKRDNIITGYLAATGILYQGVDHVY